MIIQRQRVDKYKENELAAGIKPSSINARLTILRMMLKFAVEQGKLNQMPQWKRAREIKRFEPIPDYDDVIKFLNKLPIEHLMPLKFSLYTGLSWAEVRRMQWDDIDGSQVPHWKARRFQSEDAAARANRQDSESHHTDDQGRRVCTPRIRLLCFRRHI